MSQPKIKSGILDIGTVAGKVLALDPSGILKIQAPSSQIWLEDTNGSDPLDRATVELDAGGFTVSVRDDSTTQVRALLSGQVTTGQVTLAGGTLVIDNATTPLVTAIGRFVAPETSGSPQYPGYTFTDGPQTGLGKADAVDLLFLSVNDTWPLVVRPTDEFSTFTAQYLEFVQTPHVHYFASYADADPLLVIKRPTGAYFYVDSAAQTGTIEIKLPTAVFDSDTFVRIVIRGYNSSSTTGQFEVVISGNNDGSPWTNPTISVSGKPIFTSVRFAERAGDRQVILLGTTGTVWDNPHVWVEEVAVMHAGQTWGWETGWAITQITSETGITSITTKNIPVYSQVQTAVKTGNTDRSSTTVLADDPHLTVPLEASTRYQVDAFLLYEGITTGTQGIKIALGYSGSTVTGTILAADHSGNGTPVMLGPYSGTTQFTVGTISTSTGEYARITGVFSTNTAGTLAVQWAQSTSDPNATRMQTGSWIRLTKM